ncbi:MAG: hydantoinase/oxoprolinase family protein [Gammaproteobacteria bacterium]|nr:hydantoinase/oxoprolinase family protein [Gammaproteobacteria bacterium]MDH4254551.1 hydantoinase/oxoprolinase family protein [Gammaproteobacteria bacterium]MDH5310401.1 hydantoinase/oxoprolinase family protein [Gammaproteobacteria bacterium]
MRIGIDVGGTHTDAVLLDGDDVVAATKALTTDDVSSGIIEALDVVLAQAGVAEASIEAVMLGTTQFTNAVVQRRELAEVAAIRVGLPSGDGLPPKTGWPDDIARSLGDHCYMLPGGYLYDGNPLAELRDADIDRVVVDIRRKKILAVSIASSFSPMNPEPELRIERHVRAAIPEARITLSHRLGRLGILERENAAMLNSALLDFADRVVSSFGKALRLRGLSCRFFISQNDGTLMDAEFVRNYPALTFASGPTNSLRGACRLTGLDDAIVVDIGGTTSDIGVLQDGFPRESNIVIEVGGIRTNFRMPDILAIGLGGGSLVTDEGRTIGPRSVGHRLVTEGLVFGGQTLTATDLVVAAGKASVGEASHVQAMDPAVVSTGLEQIVAMLDHAIEKMKPSSKPMPVVLVGGGAMLVTRKLKAASEMLCPEHSGVANAIGAAIAQVGGEIERLVSYRSQPRQEAIAALSREATANAVAAGADPKTIRIADVDETAVSYMAEGTVKLRVKAVGDIAGLGKTRKEDR